MSDEPMETAVEGRIEVRTARLRLVALDAELARLQAEDRPAFFAALNAKPEAAWPPDRDDAVTRAHTRVRLESCPDEAGWHDWVFLMAWAPGEPDRAVGAGRFHGPPDETGAIEIGYAMLPSFREQGLATEAVEGMLSWAVRDERVRRVHARTLAHLAASRRVLEKTGFEKTRPDADDAADVVRYVRDAA